MGVLMKTKKLISLALAVILLFALVPTTTAITYSGSFSTIGVGDYRSFAIKSDGSLWGWGANTLGELGDGNWGNTKISPIKIMDDVVTISVGDSHSLAIKSDGSLWAWGSNQYGKLGDSTAGNFAQNPIKIMDDVIAISAGKYHSLAIKSDRSLWAFGDNDNGKLGDGTKINKSTPVKIMDNVIAISAGAEHSLAIKSDGTLWAWGSNHLGRLGIDDNVNNKLTPEKIMDNVIAIGARGGHSLAIKSDGSLWAWGDNQYGQIGDGTTGFSSYKSTPVKIMDNVIAISAGEYHSFAIKSDGTLWAWGRNHDGQLGDGTGGGGWADNTGNKSTPVKIMDDVISISAGMSHNLAIKNDGTLLAWGANTLGQLGDGTLESKSVPIKIMDGVMLPMISDPLSSASDWAINDIKSAISKKLVPIVLQNNYKNDITRAEFCALAVALYETVTGEEITERTKFIDTNDINVEKAAFIKVVNGVGNDKFDPNAGLTREQAATMLSRLAEAVGKPLQKQTATFADKTQISDWALEAVGQMQITGIMQGVGDNRFDPKNSYTREQSIITILRLFNVVN